MIKLVVVVVVVVLALVVAVVLVAGARAPVRHIATVSIVVPKAPGEIWPVLSDFATWPTWNSAVQRMERLPDSKDGHPVWAFTSRGDALPSEVMEATPPSSLSSAPVGLPQAARLVTRIADDKLPFGGTWTWVMTPEGASSSRVVISEDGVIKNIVFRGMSSLFFGYTGSQTAYLTSLAKHFGSSDPHPTIEGVTFPPPPP